MLIQIHMLQNYAPANLNRDDTGSPKDAIFGGKRRGRISSQCLKRSIRRSDTFANAFTADGLLANRTKRLPQLISAELEQQGVDETDRNNIIARLPELGGGKKLGKDDDPGQAVTSLLIFLGSTEVEEVSAKLLTLYKDVGAKKYASMKIGDIESAIVHTLPKSVDIAMFGRMTTSVAFEDIHASVQVAHALSANAVEQEFDYFTAVDDLKPDSDDAGAGMIGDVEFNSSTYYKYVNIHWDKLVENLGGDDEVAIEAVTAFLKAATTANPSGKQNSFAAHNLPDFVLVEVSNSNTPVSYANAFIKPATAFGNKTLMEDAIQKFDAYSAKLRQAYGLEGTRAFFALHDVAIDSAENVTSLKGLQTWTSAQIGKVVGNG